MEFRGAVILDGTRQAAADVAALRGELAAAGGQLALIRQSAPALGTIGQQAVAAKSPWEQLAGSMAKAKGAMAGPSAAKGPGFLAIAKTEAKNARDFLAQAGEKLRGDTSAAAGEAASKATGLVGAAGAALLAAAGVAGVASLTRLALGYRGMAQLQQLGLRAQMQFRQLFTGVNPAPVVRAADRFLQIFSKGTVEGKALTGIFDRVFNGMFRGIEAAEPYATAFVDGLILGSLKVENSWLRARIMLLPITTALEAATGQTDGLGLAAEGASGAFRILATTIDGIAAGIKAISDGYNALDTKFRRAAMPPEQREAAEAADRAKADQQTKDDAASARGRRDVYTSTNGGKPTLDHSVAAIPPAAPPDASADARPAGQATGAAFAAGMVQGALDGKAAVAAAGGELAHALDDGTRAAGQVHSPSLLMRKTGRQFPAGMVQGVDDGADDVQAAGARSLMPRPPAPEASTGGSSSAPRGPVALHFHFPGVTSPKAADDVRAAVRVGIAAEWRQVAQALGVSLELT